MAGSAIFTLLLAGVIAVAGAFYVNYRNAEAGQVTHITSISQIVGVAATECSYDIGAYGQGSAGNMYIDNNRLRVDIPDLETTDYEGNMQAVLASDGTFELDPSSIPAGVTEQTTADVLNEVITQAPWRCGPWWFPDSTLFSIPDALNVR
jgi:hypothetical protein